MIRTQNIFMHVNISSIALLTFKKNEHLKSQIIFPLMSTWSERSDHLW